MTLDEQLRFAIAHRRLIQVSYNGRMRVVEPHDYGILNGSTTLLVYQLREAGAMPRAKATGWRLFEVSTISACALLEERFPGSRGQSDQQHMTWDELFARVT